VGTDGADSFQGGTFVAQISLRVRIAIILAISGTVILPACHRGYYRRMADSDANNLVLEKITDPRLTAATGELTVDPASRMFDPFSRDHPPIPPDDPESHKLMNCVDGRSGYPHWHANGDTSSVENPEWTAWLPRNGAGVVLVDARSAVELAYLHSGDYQRQREELYLSALDVSLERFGFDSQLFAGFNSFFDAQGSVRGGGSARSNLSTGLGATGGGNSLRKLGTTGTTFVVGLANTVIWNFAGANTQSASSLVNFSLIQPLMRGGGRDRIMESLTQAERSLLANVRQMQRYQEGFHLQVVTGRSAGPGPSRGGTFLNLPPGAAINAGGILGLLETQQQIRFAEFNVQQQQDVSDQLREFFLRQRIDLLQVRQSENVLYDAQAALLRQRTDYQNQLDRFKQTLGLPPWLELKIEDSFLEQFKLIGDNIQDRQFTINQMRKDVGVDLGNVRDLKPLNRAAAEVPGFQWPAEIDVHISGLKPQIEKALAVSQQVFDEDLKELDTDLAKLQEVRPRRLEYLSILREQVLSGDFDTQVDMTLLDPANIPEAAKLHGQLQETVKKLATLQTDLKALIVTIDGITAMRENSTPGDFFDFLDDKLLVEIPRQLTLLSNYLIELSLTQAQARSNSIELQEVDIDAQSATAIARCLRLDWMNARASLVDSWRQIEFAADQLESQFDLVFDGSVGNVGDNPFKLRFDNGNLRGGFRFDTPLIRMAERNQYRQALIRYQQTRRAYYQFEDEISRNLRISVRTIQLNRLLFELNRVNVQVAIQQVEAARFRLDEPAPFQAGGGGRSSLGATTARDLTGAISQLNRVQTQFLNVWVDYESLRRNLDYDLGTFRLDENGQWIDPGVIDTGLAWRFCAEMGLDPTCLECEELTVEPSSPGIAPANEPPLPVPGLGSGSTRTPPGTDLFGGTSGASATRSRSPLFGGSGIPAFSPQNPSISN